VTAHCFRHSRITYWAETSGHNLAGVQYVADHTKASTTEKYIKAGLRAAEAVLSGWLRDERVRPGGSPEGDDFSIPKQFQAVRGGGLEPADALF
jgi:hypothetical protein